MLTTHAGVPGAADVSPTLSSDEASQLEALRSILPAGWLMELQSDVEMAWAAFIYQSDAPRNSPMFTICRWNDSVGLLMQWMDGTASSATAFTKLWPVLELVLDRIFAFTQAHLATVPTTGWASTRH